MFSALLFVFSLFVVFALGAKNPVKAVIVSCPGMIGFESIDWIGINFVISDAHAIGWQLNRFPRLKQVLLNEISNFDKVRLLNWM